MNDSDGDVVCYLGQCELLNQSTCLKLERPKEENLTYDLDGCFSSSQLRDTVEYGDYQQVGCIISSHLRDTVENAEYKQEGLLYI